MAKVKRPWWVKLIIIVAAVVGGLSLILGGAVVYFRASVSDYYANSEAAFLIPDTGKGFIAQGLDYDADTETFLVSGYKKDGSASPVYVVDKATGETTKQIFLKNTDGEVYTGHSGGVAVHGKFVYVASGKVYVYSYDALKAAESGAYLDCIGTFDSITDETDGLGAAFVTVNGNHLVIGEFYREQNYKTPASHKFNTTAGDYCQSVAISYAFDASAPLGLKEKPDAAYALPDLSQGMCFNGDEVYVSCSYALAFSDIWIYSLEKANTGAKFTFLGDTLPLYELDSASLTKDCKIAPMSEELVYVGGKVYVMCESASDKYIFGKFTGGEWCYATDFSKMKG